MAIIHANDETFHEEINGEIPVLVDFYAEWCGPCKMLAPILESISNDRSNVKIVKVDVDKATKVAQEFGVMSIPTIVVFKNGQIISKKIGLCSEKDIIEMIDI